MADEIDVSLASYEELMDLEKDFESAELEIRKYLFGNNHPGCKVVHGLSL